MNEPVTTKLEKVENGKELLNNGVSILERLQTRLENQLKRTLRTIEDIQKLCKERNVKIPELEAAVSDLNELKVFKARLDNYMREVRDDNNSMEKRFAILSVMVELSETINNKVV